MLRRLDAEKDMPWLVALITAGLGCWQMGSHSLDLDALKSLSSSSTVIGTVLFGFVSSTLAIFLSNDKNPIVTATRDSATHKARMLRFFKEALLAATLLILMSVTYTVFNARICESSIDPGRNCLLFLSAWFGIFAWLFATVGRVYFFIFNMLD